MTALEPLHAYFGGEKNAGAFVALLGVASIAFAVWLWRDQHAFRAMLYPMALIGLIQIGIGVGLYVKTPAQVSALAKGLGAGDRSVYEAEQARMAVVNRNWIIIEVAEVVLIFAALAAIFFMRARPVLSGVAMGILIEASVMLVFDLFAEHRAKIYTEWLARLVL